MNTPYTRLLGQPNSSKMPRAAVFFGLHVLGHQYRVVWSQAMGVEWGLRHWLARPLYRAAG
ncbi:hypothetical protein ACI5FT_01410 [Ectothiorhodospira haloalkaliphila]|uniref:hypothetical protein n=1 Tax=Ectothiorhodospira haloalkaliphila TaxID=421628 RepID=UPI0012EC0C39|nr:hypothetical protein [Ectothiorhodospira haloalkaliphila]